MKALDLFCGAGGATRGLQLAGFHVTGVDMKAQPRYVGDVFIQGDALNHGLDLSTFDFIWASPPCQAHTALKTMHNAKPHLDLIPQTRAMLKASGVPWVIENVVGAPLLNPVTLCGSMFGLTTADGVDLHRHRIFESSFPLPARKCVHTPGRNVIGIYGGHVRNRKRLGCGAKGQKDFTTADACEAMQVDWMTLAELCQAIPPAYSKFIGNVAKWSALL